MYRSTESPSLCDVEALVYVQEAQLDKFRQKLDMSTVIANIAHTSQAINRLRETFSSNRGRENRFTRDRGRGISRATIGKISPSLPHNTINSQSNNAISSGTKQDQAQEASQNSQAMAMVATTNQSYAFTQEYSLPSQLESQAWFADSVKFVDMFRNKTGYKIVEPAHMEMAKPTIGDAFQSCVQQGARRVIIAPFFLATGKHINKDIPSLSAEAAKKHPGVSYIITPPLGLHVLLVDIVNERINSCLKPIAQDAPDCSVCDGTGKCQKNV
ncbi:hypothetical protein KIW84_011409 [Lathyrus oleraceus]|uniref:Sirohydrochlorin ferrochelatase n=1 Tax=Pisum sativum TaxID=3888 RepID=A0A9D5BEV2_PEA|nr:hypothetical protein KIW84_011409 [Pisum sativum]